VIAESRNIRVKCFPKCGEEGRSLKGRRTFLKRREWKEVEVKEKEERVAKSSLSTMRISDWTSSEGNSRNRVNDISEVDGGGRKWRREICCEISEKMDEKRRRSH